MDDTGRLVLIARTPLLSDTAKITLQTMYAVFLHAGCFPTISELSRLRGVTIMSIRNHQDEMISAGVLRKEKLENVIRYAILWNNISKSLGFARPEDVDVLKVSSVPQHKDIPPEQIRVRIEEPKTSQEMLAYFSGVYYEKIGKVYSKTRKDDNRLRCLINKYGHGAVREMIDFFAKHRGRLMIGAFSVETLFTSGAFLFKRIDG